MNPRIKKQMHRKKSCMHLGLILLSLAASPYSFSQSDNSCVDLSGIYEFDSSPECISPAGSVIDLNCDRASTDVGTDAENNRFIPGGEFMLQQRGCEVIHMTYDSEYDPYSNRNLGPGKARCELQLQDEKGSGWAGRVRKQITFKDQSITKKIKFNSNGGDYKIPATFRTKIQFTKNSDKSMTLFYRGIDTNYFILHSLDKAKCRMKWKGPAPALPLSVTPTSTPTTAPGSIRPCPECVG